LAIGQFDVFGPQRLLDRQRLVLPMGAPAITRSHSL